MHLVPLAHRCSALPVWSQAGPTVTGSDAPPTVDAVPDATTDTDVTVPPLR